jgi:hypothetical protein
MRHLGAETSNAEYVIQRLGIAPPGSSGVWGGASTANAFVHFRAKNWPYFQRKMKYETAKIKYRHWVCHQWRSEGGGGGGPPRAALWEGRQSGTKENFFLENLII